MEFLRVTGENLDREHICCALTGADAAGKKAWLADRFADGLVFCKGDARGKCFVEYLPGEKAWAPVEAEGLLWINCLWVSGQLAGQGNAGQLRERCEQDALDQGRGGLTILSADKKRLVEVAKQSLDVGLQYVQPWRKIGDMGAAIHEFALENGYSVVKQIGGHGVGLEFHEDPWVSYVCPKDTGMLMVPGMMFTIEPMINMGKDEIYISDEDDWTVYTEDGMPSAQWEIQVLVTEDGYEIISY